MIYPVLCVDIYVISLFTLMESKKTKKIAFFPLCRVPHSAKRALPSAVTMALGKAGKQRPNFPALPSARAMEGSWVSQPATRVMCEGDK